MRHHFLSSVLAAYLLLLSTMSPATNLVTRYVGSLESYANGTLTSLPVQAELERTQNRFVGIILVDNYRYQLSSTKQSDVFRGQLKDQSGGQVPVQLHTQPDNTLSLTIYLNGEFAQPQTLILSPGNNSVQNSRPSATQSNHALDHQLIGRWVYSESYTSGEYAFGAQDWVELSASGEVFSASQSFGGGPDSNVISGAQRSPAGHWRVQQNANGDRLLSLNENGQWYLYGRYYIENGRMLITRANGEKEFWRQQQ